MLIELDNEALAGIGIQIIVRSVDERVTMIEKSMMITIGDDLQAILLPNLSNGYTTDILSMSQSKLSSHCYLVCPII